MIKNMRVFNNLLKRANLNKFNIMKNGLKLLKLKKVDMFMIYIGKKMIKIKKKSN